MAASPKTGVGRISWSALPLSVVFACSFIARADPTITLQEAAARKSPEFTVLHEGQVLCEGPVDQVQKDERVMEVYLGRSRDSDA